MEERKEEPKKKEAEVVEAALQGNKKMRRGACGWLRERKVRDLVRDKRRLVEVPYTATLAHTVNALVANCVSAVPVAAPPGQWIGAGGSMILESDRATGAVRKHYIGMVTMLDLLAHISEKGDQNHGAGDESSAGPERNLERRMSGKGKRLIETFSATDLRLCPVVLLQPWLSLSVTEFKERLSMRGSNASIAPPVAGDDPTPETRRLITCYPETSLSDAIESAVSNHVHRLWVVDGEGLLQGVVSLADMLRVVRDAVLRAEQELEGVVQHG
ncbi:hypothetical protein B296_00020245 [Ensete ventricosum]|uniref:CBS domain-containing protein n=1 Tax=Ensete ventricosum TaxID=4639 RepID=A0A426ZH58_ENSVE|nr:hypothetical protein B296_00020245 [Ensete ventricosum]